MKSKSWKDCKSMGDVMQYVSDHGAQEIRTNGSHKIFRGPNGKMFPIQFNHPSWDITPGMKSKIRREMVDAGIPVK